LIAAAEKKYFYYYRLTLRQFEVIVVENNLTKCGHKMAEKLAEKKIKTTVIPDTAIFAFMPRVHKAFFSSLKLILTNQ
jgi:translation initiation factor 2B subunit (eIF-2B alpha/beta/delta family)